MDAYSSYIMSLSEARVGELRREAAEYAMSRAARGERLSRWARARERIVRTRRAEAEPVAPIALPADSAGPELRRSA